MSSLAWTRLFAAALVASLAMRDLAARAARCATSPLHRDEVPAAFRATVPLAAHQQGRRLHARQGTPRALADDRFGAAVLLGWTLFGGLDALNVAVRETVAPRWGALAYEVALFVAFVADRGLLDLPFDCTRPSASSSASASTA